MLHKKKSIRQQRLALCLLALLVLLPTGESAAEISGGAPNQWQDRCISAVNSMAEDAPLMSLYRTTFREAWSAPPASREDYQKKLDRLQQQITENWVNTLRPAVEAGHLPSIHYLLDFRTEGKGLLDLDDRETLTTALYEAGFPLASKPIPNDARSRGFFGNHKLPPTPYPAKRELTAMQSERFQEREQRYRGVEEFEGEYITHADSAKLRSAYIEALRWSAVRGNSASWSLLESTYGMIADDWGGGVEYRIEQYAWLEFTKRLWGGPPGDEYNVPAMEQEDLGESFENSLDLARARELANEYMEVLWPRRIEGDATKGFCALQPQFASDPAPYADEPPLLRVLAMPTPPADPKQRPAGPRMIKIQPTNKNCDPTNPQEWMRNRCGGY